MKKEEKVKKIKSLQQQSKEDSKVRIDNTYKIVKKILEEDKKNIKKGL